MTGSLVYGTGDRYGPPTGAPEEGSHVYTTGFRYGPPPWPGGRRHPSGTIVTAPDLPPALAPRIQITLQRVLARLDEELTPGRQSAAVARAQFLASPGRTFIDPLTGITVFLEGDQLVVGVPESPSALARFDGGHFVDVPPEEWPLQLAGAGARLQALVAAPGQSAQPDTAGLGGGVPWGLLLVGVGAGAYWYGKRNPR